MGLWSMSPRTLGFLVLAVAFCSAGWPGAAEAGPYRLPWSPETSMELTQDCNDSFYSDHIDTGSFAWDFANGTHFAVSAARAGVVTHLKMSSRSGCNTSACVDQANYLVVDHGDGTASIYLHLDGDSLDQQVRCGQRVEQGQHLASAGSTGWSTGPHLHFQVNPVHPNADRTCECGDNGKACAEDYAAWPQFWSNKAFPSQPVVFDEWSATACGDRRMVLPVSQNAASPAGMPAAVARAALPAPVPKTPTPSAAPESPAGVGGRRAVRAPKQVSGKSAPRKREIPRPSRKARSSRLPHR
jgi:hypothetical protein